MESRCFHHSQRHFGPNLAKTLINGKVQSHSGIMTRSYAWTKMFVLNILVIVKVALKLFLFIYLLFLCLLFAFSLTLGHLNCLIFRAAKRSVF